jgi:hypothetical protein
VIREYGSPDVFFSEQIWSTPTGYDWRIECVHVDAFHGKGGFNETAGGFATFKWLARRKLRHYKRQFLREALESTDG